MTTSSMVDPYDNNLQHMAEPSAPQARQDAVSISLNLVQAAVFREMLREWALQRQIAQDRSQIALGYVEWIERQLQRGDSHDIRLYVHTSLAEQVLDDVLYDMWDEVDEMVEYLRGVEEEITEAWGRHHTDDFEDEELAPEPAPEELEGVPQDG